MTLDGWLLIAVFVLVVGVTIRPLGAYMAWIFTGQHASIRFLRFFERAFFRLTGVDPSGEQNWLNYAVALLIFNLAGMILLFAILTFQAAAQSAAFGTNGAGPRIQHGGELRNEHELAGLRGGNDPQLF